MYNQHMQNYNPQSQQFMMEQPGFTSLQQQPNIIKNPQTGVLPKAKGPRVNDRDSVNFALSQEKYITDSLNIFAREASHRLLHNDIMNILNETHAMARELFNLMFRKGWYTLEAEQPQKLAETQQQFTRYSSQFPYPLQ